MEVTKPMVAIVAATCVTVGAAGGYLLTRHAGTTAPEATTAALVADAGASGVDPSAPVEQSEALVGETSQPAATASAAPVVAPAPVPARTAPPARPAAPPASHAPAPAAPATPPAPALTDITPVAPAPIEPARPVAEVDPVPAKPVAVDPPAPEYEDLVLNTDKVIGLRIKTTVSSETARVEDPVTATVTRDVKVGDHVAIPSGSEVRGEVTLVEKGGKLKDRARLGVRFTSIVLADGMRVPISTETIYRDGDAPGRESTTKIGGGAIGGAIIGGILGGAKGAAIGSAIGGGAGGAAVMAGGRNPALISEGTALTVRLQQPATVTIER
jgi:hypothetical protein